VLGLAGRKVAATSSVELEVGDHLTLGTEGEQAGVTVLRVIQHSRGGEAPWRGLLRSLLATRVGATGTGAAVTELAAHLQVCCRIWMQPTLTRCSVCLRVGCPRLPARRRRCASK